MSIASFAAAARLRHLSSSSSHLSASEMISQATTFTSTSPSNKENGTQQPIMIVPPKCVMFLRHGQALHNPRAEVARENGCSFEAFLQLMEEDDAYDADLTSLGEEQAKEAGSQEHIRDSLQNIDMIVSSPLSRAIRTADLVHSSPKNKLPPKRVAIEEFREINGKLLNAKRRPKDELEALFPHWNFSLIPSIDDTWTEDLEAHHECSERGYKGMLWIMQQIETNILVVAHGGLLNMMMNDHPRVVLVDGRKEEYATDSDRCVTQRFGNCELRSYIMSAWHNGTESEDKNVDPSLHDYQPVITLEEVTMQRTIP